MIVGKVRALKAKFVNPQIVIESLNEWADKLDEIYVVAIPKEGDQEDPIFWSSGDLKGFCFAAVAMMEMAQRYTRGEMEQEE